MRLKGKKALVTGGASGIGQAIVKAFAAEGADVFFTYQTSEPAPTLTAARAHGVKAFATRADLRREDETERVMTEILEHLGQLDIVVANTGGLIGRARAVDMSLELWSDVMATNLTSTFLTCRAALRHMEPRRTGNLILISSLAGHNGGGPGASHYGAAKGAMITYTRALAKEVGPLGIRVNGIAPGLIATRFHDTFNTPEGRRSTVEATPLRREGTSEDVAGSAVFLASDESSFLAGETIEVNGGYGLY
ncbi:MAG TPA: SDR family oxidoreductase [Burkholderiales bacterium]|nr:SDR family oxidoreductase [Burkholderiales bacterium]